MRLFNLSYKSETPNYLIDFVLFEVLFLIMQILYPLFVVENYSYMGYFFSFEPVRLILANISVAAILLWVVRLEGFSLFVSGVFTVMNLFPNAVLFAMHPLYQPVIYLLVFIFMCLLVYVLGFSNFKFIVPEVKKISNYGTVIILLVGVLAMFPFFVRFGFNINWDVFSLGDKVYEVRKHANELNSHLMSYLFGNLVKVLFPIGMIWFLSRRNYLLFFLFFLFQVYLFAVEGHKSVFLALPLVFLIFIRGYRLQLRLILIVFIVILSGGFLIYLYNGMLLPESLFYRRGILTSALLNVFYFDFFAHHSVYLSYSVMKHFVEYPYDITPSFIIGRSFFDNPAMSANNGFLSDGFTNFGYAGAILYLLLVVVYFKFLKDVEISYKFSGVIFIVIFTLLSTSLTTSVFTHGLFLFTALMLLFGRGE